MKKTNTRTKAKTLEKHILGAEPMIPEITGRSDANLTKALNWYSYTSELKEGKEWLLVWMKNSGYSKDDISNVRASSDAYLPTTICWIARMANNGTKFSEANLKYVDDQIKIVIGRYKASKEAKQEAAKPVVDLQKRIQLKNWQFYALAESEVVDQAMLGQKVSMYEFLKRHELNPQQAAFLLERYQPSLDEIMSNDPDIKEAYGRSQRIWQKFWNEVIDDLNRYIGNKKSTKVRKPRTPKAKPLSKIVESVKYQKEDVSLKIVSISPQEIVGAQQLWTYNTKTKKLAVYHANSTAGLSFKGTTLQGFDLEKSVEKNLRKPVDNLKAVLTSGKVAIRKVMGSINSKEYKPTGRMNDHTIFLRGLK